jgi:hypothetical protein
MSTPSNGTITRPTCGKLNVVTERNPMPSPPYPSPDSDALRVILAETMKSYEDGEVDVRGAILHAAVHGWYEGHIEGEDACPGCNHRGDVGRGILREIWIRDALRGQIPDDDSDWESATGRLRG